VFVLYIVGCESTTVYWMLHRWTESGRCCYRLCHS